MKWNPGESLRERNIRLSQWHPWWAWYPVQIDEHDCRWLEWVLRRAVLSPHVNWEYDDLGEMKK